MFVQWEMTQVLFTRAELHRLHFHIVHPDARKLYTLIRRARPDEVDPNTLKVVEEIAEDWRECKAHSPRPYRFCVSILTLCGSIVIPPFMWSTLTVTFTTTLHTVYHTVILSPSNYNLVYFI